MRKTAETERERKRDKNRDKQTIAVVLKGMII